MGVNIFLDIDDVVFKFQECFALAYGTKPQKTWVSSPLFYRRLNALKQRKEFWLTLEMKHMPNFQPKGFVSARSIPKSWTVESLRINKVPGRSNVHQVPWNHSKVELLRSLGCEIFIDDKYKTFKECHQAGLFCLLMDASHNQRYKTKYRIDTLDIKVIMEKYNEWKLEKKST